MKNKKPSKILNDAENEEIAKLVGLFKGIDVKEINEKTKKDNEKIAKPAEQIIQILSGIETRDRGKVAEEIGKRLHKLHYDESPTLRNFVIDSIIDGLVKEYAKTILEQINYIVENQDEDNSYGDADNTVDIILRNEGKDVITIKDNCSCGTEVYWIIINNKEEEKVDIRVIYEEESSDYPKNEYPKRLSLKFYEDRGWSADYIKELHFTNLGGCYGDIRDKGYIISFEYGNELFARSNETNGNVDYICSQRNFTQNLDFIYNECKRRKEDLNPETI